MKSKIIWVSALLPLFGMMIFSLLPKLNRENDSKNSGAVVATDLKKISSTKESSKDSNRDTSNQDLVNKRRNELMAKMGHARTPEFQEFLVDGLMRSRNPQYQALFLSWQLDKESSGLILDCIRDRELGFQKAMRKLELNGVTGRMDFAADVEAEKYLADFQLETVLGSERFTEFAALESKMGLQMRAKARKIINSKLAD